MELKSVLLDEKAIKRTLTRVAHEIIEKNKGIENIILVGIKRRGVPIAERIEATLENMEYIIDYSRAGSIRRVRETIKDLDFIIATEEPLLVKEQLLKIDGIQDVISAGDTKVSIVIEFEYEVSIDFRLVKPKEFATTLHHFTGSKDHNVRMRQLAKKRGEKISEYGVENNETGEVKTFDSEKEYYAYFELPLIPPEMREDGIEVEEYQEGLGIINLEDIKGDLHMHTTWSDGAHSIEEMAQACMARGYQYIAITDHSQYLKVANGLTPERLLKQIEEIRAVNEKYADIEVFCGTEMDILPDGTLDFEDEILEQLDFVIASIHSSFNQPQEQIMERLHAACKNPHVHMIAHPTGRIVGQREGYNPDIEQLIKWASEYGKILEVNASPYRLDLRTEHLIQAIEAGVNIAINTDAHATEQLDIMPIGVEYAQKAWLPAEQVINTWPLETFIEKVIRR